MFNIILLLTAFNLWLILLGLGTKVLCARRRMCAAWAPQGYQYDHSWHQERTRLAMLEQIEDPGTIRHLQTLGVTEGWQCLEIGAGGGSIADWLCKRVGSGGHVTATDLETKFLMALDHANLEILRHDIVNDDLPEAAFDLVHERAVLTHIPERDARRLAALRGGRLLPIRFDLRGRASPWDGNDPIPRDKGRRDQFRPAVVR